MGSFEPTAAQRRAIQSATNRSNEKTPTAIAGPAGSEKYSDVFVSTTPHKAKGIGDASSLVEFLEGNVGSVPKLTVFGIEDGTLKKASKTELKIALRKSALHTTKRGNNVAGMS